MSSGYIREWDALTRSGMIRLCDGGGLVDDGEEAAFGLSDCNAALASKLRDESSFRLARRCNPEPLQESIKVRCGVTVGGGGVKATNVREIGGN